MSVSPFALLATVLAVAVLSYRVARKAERPFLYTLLVVALLGWVLLFMIWQ